MKSSTHHCRKRVRVARNHCQEDMASGQLQQNSRL